MAEKANLSFMECVSNEFDFGGRFFAISVLFFDFLISSVNKLFVRKGTINVSRGYVQDSAETFHLKRDKKTFP